MKVVQVINGEHYSGAERVQDLLALGLGKLGIETAFACIKPDRFPAQRAARDVPLYEIPMRARLDLRCALQLARLLKTQGFDLLHTHTPRAALMGRIASAISGVPMVHHVHSPTTRDTEVGLRNRVNAVAENLSLKGARCLIPVSRSLEHYLLRQGHPQDILRTVYNGVPTPGPLSAREPPRSPWAFGVVALFRARKGLEVLLDAAARLKASGASFVLRAVGGFESPEYEAQIHSMVQRLGLDEQIQWVGFASDMNQEYARLDALVLPSLYGEGMPMVILEALACGVPVIATRVEGVPEVLEHERSGLIVPPGDAEPLAATMRDLVRGKVDWSALRSQGYALQVERFSDTAMSDGVASAYREFARPYTRSTAHAAHHDA